MKKVLGVFAIAVLLTASSCNSTKNLTTFLTNHNFQESHILNPATGQVNLHASIDSLYDYSKVVALCDTADITFHISKGSIIVDADCTGAGETLVDIFKNILSKIKFTK